MYLFRPPFPLAVMPGSEPKLRNSGSCLVKLLSLASFYDLPLLSDDHKGRRPVRRSLPGVGCHSPGQGRRRRPGQLREAIELYLETGACPRQPDAHALCDYRLAARSSTYAFTVSKASAEFVNRLRANADSVSRKNASRSSSSANSIATPRSLSGASVGIARNSLTLSPRSPGNVAQPS